MSGPAAGATAPKDSAGAGPSRQADPEAQPDSNPSDQVEDEEEEDLLATVGEGELVQMVPCALLDGAELVELTASGGEPNAGGPYLALDASMASSATGGATTSTTTGLYYYASYGGEIDALDPAGTSGGATACLYAAPASSMDAKPFLTAVDGHPSPAMTANSSGVVVAPIDPTADRAESPEEKKTPKEKTIARVVMAVACTLLTLCIILVGVTLSMSEHINSMVRQIHGGPKQDGKDPLASSDKNTTSKLNPTDSSR